MFYKSDLHIDLADSCINLGAELLCMGRLANYVIVASQADVFPSLSNCNLHCEFFGSSEASQVPTASMTRAELEAEQDNVEVREHHSHCALSLLAAALPVLTPFFSLQPAHPTHTLAHILNFESDKALRNLRIWPCGQNMIW